jgi:hypothetical protein
MHRSFRLVLRYSPASASLAHTGYVRHLRGFDVAAGGTWHSWVPRYGSNLLEA